MEREILFRGKRKDNGEWVYGYPLIDTAPCSLKAKGACVCPHDGSQAYIISWDDPYHEYNYVDVIPETIGQYTGLTDKNGAKIFEGDFLGTRTEENDYVYLVVYGLVECSGYGFGVEGVILDDSSYADYSGELCPLNKFLEDHVPMMVIGNVHDSPKVESCRWRNAECGLDYPDLLEGGAGNG